MKRVDLVALLSIQCSTNKINTFIYLSRHRFEPISDWFTTYDVYI